MRRSKKIVTYTKTLKGWIEESYRHKDITVVPLAINEDFHFLNTYERTGKVRTMMVGKVTERRRGVLNFAEMFRKAFPKNELELTIVGPESKLVANLKDICLRNRINLKLIKDISDAELNRPNMRRKE